MALDAVLARIDRDLPAATERLLDFLRIPSISTDPDHAGECRRAAAWLAADLASMGVKAGLHPTAGHPMVLGHAGDSGRKVLFYGHYDVQPVDPLELWHRAPSIPR